MGTALRSAEGLGTGTNTSSAGGGVYSHDATVAFDKARARWSWNCHNVRVGATSQIQVPKASKSRTSMGSPGLFL